MTPRRLITGLLLSLALTAPAFAKPPEGKGKPEQGAQGNSASRSHAGQGGNGGDQSNPGNAGRGGKWEDNDRDGRVDLDVVLLEGIIRDNRYSGYQSLPPGIRKNLARGKPIPPGLQSRVVPGPLLGQLPYREGYEWRVYGRDLVLLAVTTGIVEEVLSEIFD